MRNSLKIFKGLFAVVTFLAFYCVLNDISALASIGSGVGASTAMLFLVGSPNRNNYRGSGFGGYEQGAREMLSSFGGNRNPQNRNTRRANQRMVNNGTDFDREVFSNAGGPYTGYNDPFLSFGGVRNSFMDVLTNRSNKKFIVKLQNTSLATDYNIDLMPGIIGDPGTTNFLLTDGAIPGTGGNVTATPGWLTVNTLTKYHQFNPTCFLGLQVTSDNSLQIGANCTYQEQDPYHPTWQTDPIPWINNTDEGDFKTGFLTVDNRSENIAWGNQSVMTLQVVANSTSTICFFYGPTLNTTHALKDKYQKGVNNAAAQGVNVKPISGKVR